MRSRAAVHPSPVHLAMLRIAGLLVPDESRAEWLAEWRSELWYASREYGPESAWTMGSRPLTAFCLGSFKDALWLRRNTPRSVEPEKRWLESPKQCLAFLGVLALASVLTACLLWPGTQSSMASADIQGAFIAFKFFLTFGCSILPAFTSLSLGELHGRDKGFRWSLQLRRWVFLSAKIVLILLILYCGSLIWACNDVPPALGLFHWIGLLGGCTAALRWALNDQRRRCPECLQLLTRPVSVSGGSECFLESSCKGSMCPSGHGLLYVPENPTSWFSTQRWLCLDPSGCDPS